jgi:glycosyltransferase involved in cell wall biosynthesis
VKARPPTMRVLQVVTSPQRRGAEVFAFTLAAELRRRGHELATVYLYRHDRPAALPVLAEDVVLPSNGKGGWRRMPGFDPRRLVRLGRAIRRFDPDLVQLNGGPTVGYGALAARAAPGRRWATVYRNIGDPDRWLAGRLRRALYRRLVGPCLDGMVGVSAATLAAADRVYGNGMLRRQIGRAVDPAALVPSAAAAAVRARLGTAVAVPVVLFVGSLTPEKRLDLLLGAIGRLAEDRPGIELWVSGDGPLRADLESRAAALGARCTVRFLGVRPDVADLLAACDLLALSSDSEGMPGVLLEAGLAGRAAVATAVGGVSECVLPGETALLVPAGDEEAFAGALAVLLADPERRARMGRRARDWVAERFTIGPIAGEYEVFYGEAIAHRRAAVGR